MDRLDDTRANTVADTRATSAGSGASAENDAPDPFVGRVLSQYHLERRLGAGGMGAVYLARDRALDRPAAIKVLPLDFPPDLRERLVREGRMSARLQHPGIATFYEAGSADGLDFIAMEYVPGRTLRERILEGPMPTDEAIAIASGMLEGLAHAHAYGLIHRDIKPANVMITEDGSPRLLDLGLARALWPEAEGDSTATGTERDVTVEADLGAAGLDAVLTREIGPRQAERLTQTGSVLGTIGYMSPEQLYGTIVDERTDVFAVGAVLFEMLTGRPAFVGGTLAESFAMVVHRDLEWPAGSDAPPALRSIVNRAVARRVEARYSSAAAFLADLRRVAPARRRTGAPLRIAVLPFENRTGDPDWDWLGSAVAKEIGRRFASMESLATVPDSAMAVVSHAGAGKTGSERDIAIGQQLSCWATLSGNIEGGAGGLTLDMRLVDVAAGDVTCRDRWNGLLEDVAAAHDRFASGASAALGLEAALPGVVSPSTEAFACFGRGSRLLFSAERALLDEGVRLLERAVELQPDYAMALAALAGSYAMRSNAKADSNLGDMALDRAERALAIDPGLAEAHLWRGYTLFQKERVAEGLPSLIRAMELDPSNFLAPYFASGSSVVPRSRDDARRVIAAVGGPETIDDPYEWLLRHATELARKSLRVNPRFAWAWVMLGMHHMSLREFADARWCFGRAVELEPSTLPPLCGSVGLLGECLRLEGDLVGARRLLFEALDVVEKKDHMYRDTLRGLFLSRLGLTALTQGDVEAARVAFTQAVQHLRGRPGARAGGHVLVQSMAGLAASTADTKILDEALALFHRRETFNFTYLWLCNDGTDLWVLAQAARALNRSPEAATLEQRARDAGYRLP